MLVGTVMRKSSAERGCKSERMNDVVNRFHSLRNVAGQLSKRGVGICQETVFFFGMGMGYCLRLTFFVSGSAGCLGFSIGNGAATRST
jgi:hypothetical protein